MSGNQRQKNYTARHKAVGLKQVKVWVAEGEVARLQSYAARLPATRVLRKEAVASIVSDER